MVVNNQLRRSHLSL